jgi:hypothetical protein
MFIRDPQKMFTIVIIISFIESTHHVSSLPIKIKEKAYD